MNLRISKASSQSWVICNDCYAGMRLQNCAVYSLVSRLDGYCTIMYCIPASLPIFQAHLQSVSRNVDQEPVKRRSGFVDVEGKAIQVESTTDRERSTVGNCAPLNM